MDLDALSRGGGGAGGGKGDPGKGTAGGAGGQGGGKGDPRQVSALPGGQGCFGCGGDHFARDCPNEKPKDDQEESEE